MAFECHVANGDAMTQLLGPWVLEDLRHMLDCFRILASRRVRRGVATSSAKMPEHADHDIMAGLVWQVGTITFLTTMSLFE